MSRLRVWLVMSRGGGPKKYRKDAVIRACRDWYHLNGEKPFTSKDLYESGLISFQQKTQHINARSVSFLIGVLYRQGLLELITDGKKKKQNEYIFKWP
jgi:hypothetical protein